MSVFCNNVNRMIVNIMYARTAPNMGETNQLPTIFVSTIQLISLYAIIPWYADTSPKPSTDPTIECVVETGRL